MTKAVFRPNAKVCVCAVCGCSYTPRQPTQIVCKKRQADGSLSPCAVAARAIRWCRANLTPEKAAKYQMTADSMRKRLDKLLTRVHDRTAFDIPVRESRPRRVSFAGAKVVNKTQLGELIYLLADGTEAIGWPCPICEDPSDRQGACFKPECQRAARRKKSVVKLTKPSGPWETPPPAWEGALPGSVLPITATPRPSTRADSLGAALHGALTQILRAGRGHDSRRPEWSLLLVGAAAPSGWAVWLPDDSDVAAVRGRSYVSHLFGTPTTLTLGECTAIRLRAPRVEQMGRHRVRITTVTPICMRGAGIDGNRYRGYPQTPTLWTALSQVAQRIGLLLPDPTRIGIVRVSHDTHKVKAPLKRGANNLIVTAWSGDVVVDVNPLGRWLLEVAARIGLGGRTAFGLGRIMVRDEPAVRDVLAPSPEPWEVVIDQAAQKFGTYMGVSNDEACAVLSGLVDCATFERETSSGYEVWRAGSVLLMAQPTTLRTLRVVDVMFENDSTTNSPEKANVIEELWRQNAA